MKKVLLTLMAALLSVSSYALRRDILLNNGDVQPNHFEFPVPADEPDVYYDDDAQQIIIDGTGCVSYYDVEITSQSTWDVVVSTSVNGSYDTIDISSLPDDDYIITIDSPLGNTYEGYFQTY